MGKRGPRCFCEERCAADADAEPVMVFGEGASGAAIDRPGCAEEELRLPREELDDRVRERTAVLEKSVAELRRREQALTQRYSTLRGIIEVANAPIFSVDRRYRYTSFNQRHAAVMRAIYGAEIDIGQSLLGYMTVAEDRELAQRNLDRALAGEHLSDEAYSGEELRSRLYFQVSHTPIRTQDGEVVGVAVLSYEITEHKRAEEALQRLNRELRAISSCNQTLMRAVDEASLLRELCRIICDEAGYRMAWVGYAENDEAKTVRLVASAGVDDGYVAASHLTWSDTERGRGPGGTAIRTGRSVCIQDFTTGADAAPWRENALRRGYRSAIALPLRDDSAQVFGVLAIYSTASHAFTADEVRLLDELAADMAFGIAALRSRTERKRAEDLLRKREAELSESQRVAHIGSWDWDATTDSIWWSDEYRRVYGVDPDTPPPNYAEHLKAYTPESAERLDRAVKCSMATAEPYEVTLELKEPTASTRWVVARGETKRDKQGVICGLRGTAQNVTDRMLAERELRASLEEKDTLLRELYHRTKNNMQVICSLLSLESSRTRNEELLRVLKETGGRIRAMALVHQKLYQSQNLSRIDLQEYVAELTELLDRSFKGPARGIRTTLFTESVFVSIDVAIPCGLLLNELVTNAQKHAFPAGRPGEIQVTLRRQECGPIELKVRDDGVGVRPEFDLRRDAHLGLQSVSAICEHQLRGKVELSSDHGLCCRICFRDVPENVRV